MNADAKELAGKLLKSREVKAVELNSDLRPEAIQRLIRSVADHAAKQSKIKRVTVISFVA